MPTYNSLSEDADFRLGLSALNTPDMQTALDAIEESFTPVANRSADDINSVALAAQYEAGARFAIGRVRNLLTPKVRAESEEPKPELRPWGGLFTEEDPQQ